MTQVERLKLMIRRLVCGPPGDPDRSALEAAGHAWVLLRDLGVLDTEMESELRSCGSCDGVDYIELAEGSKAPEPEGLKAALAELEKLDRQYPKIGPGSTAQLLDEAEPDGTVVLRDAQGNPRMMMPREVYDELRAWKPSV